MKIGIAGAGLLGSLLAAQLARAGHSVDVFDPAGERVSVSPNGTVRQGLTSVGKLALMSNEDAGAMQKVGENLFESTGGRMTAASGSFVPESREASTFDAVTGLTSLMEATRSYQMNARLLQMQDDMTEQLVTTLGRVA